MHSTVLAVKKSTVLVVEANELSNTAYVQDLTGYTNM